MSEWSSVKAQVLNYLLSANFSKNLAFPYSQKLNIFGSPKNSFAHFKSVNLSSCFLIKTTSYAEMSEWSNEHDWKSCDVNSIHGFKSHSLRHDSKAQGYTTCVFL